MIITLSGLPGAGKSTLKAALARELNLTPYSIGDLRGKMARERGLTIDELNTLGMTEAFTDKDVDEWQQKLGQSEDNFIIDGWLSWHFIPHSLKIFVTVDPTEGAARIFADRQNNPHRADEPEYATVEETAQTLERRVAQTDARYKKWYGVDFLNTAQYDLVIDTTGKTENETLAAVLAAIQEIGAKNG